jgi:16S rRNA G527 N7-methylase RsmG
MHYIVGTSFTVAPQTNSRQLPSRYDRLFKQGVSYQLLTIKKESDVVNYHFIDSTGTHSTVPFPSCREADTLIAKYRTETIPDYVSKMDQERPD